MTGERLTPAEIALHACARAWVKETPDDQRMETLLRVATAIRAAHAEGLAEAEALKARVAALEKQLSGAVGRIGGLAAALREAADALEYFSPGTGDADAARAALHGKQPAASGTTSDKALAAPADPE